MTAASRSLATALWEARFASGLLPQSYTTTRDTTVGRHCRLLERWPQRDSVVWRVESALSRSQ